MERRKLGRSGLEVSVVALGTWQFADARYWGSSDQGQVDRIVHEAIDLGINHIDTAEGYGRSEELLGGALQGRRERVVLATKTGGKSLLPENLPTALERSLSKLRTDYVDLYIIHWPKRDIPIDDTMAALGKLKDEGKIRSIGVSNFCVPDMEKAVPHGSISSNQLPYSLFWRMIEKDIVPKCEDLDISVTAYSPLAQGILTGKFRKKEDIPPESGRFHTRLYRDDVLPVEFGAISAMDEICEKYGATHAQVSMAWLLAQPMVASVIPGAKNVKQLLDNAGAADIDLADEDVDKLTKISEPVLKALGDDPDMWDMDRYI
jgi:aryl-alcohol dehydrogenase-like predicted oxidoreductase